MAINKIELQASGIKKALKDFTVYDAIAQYIWNGFDAEASIIELAFEYNKIDGIAAIKITDNGYGICKNELPIKFKKIFESNKAIWTTIYKDNGKKYLYKIEIDANSLEQYIDTEITESEQPCGTEVEFCGFNDNKFSLVECKEFLMLEFAW